MRRGGTNATFFVVVSPKAREAHFVDSIQITEQATAVLSLRHEEPQLVKVQKGIES